MAVKKAKKVSKVEPATKKAAAPKKAPKAKVEKVKAVAKVEIQVSGSKRLAEKRGGLAEKRTRK